MFKKLLSVSLFAFMFASLGFAQTGSITGVVTDANSGETLPVVNVVLVELNRGNPTNIDGRYTISNIPAGTYTMRASLVGYTRFQAQVTIGAGQTVQNIAMRPDVIGLDDIVVSGYGVVTKREITGSISQISSRDIEGVTFRSPDQALQGRAAGVRVTTTSGAPGAGMYVRVRGLGSINAGNDPLYIVDGVQISFVDQGSQAATNPLAALNPNDIESLEVLKDAAAAAIYGAQAANGVILITTKRGRVGRTQISATASMGFIQEIRRQEMLEGPELMAFYQEVFSNNAEFINYTGAVNAQFGTTFSPTVMADRKAAGEIWAVRTMNNFYFFANPEFQIDPFDVAGTTKHYDWQEAVTQTGLTQNYSLTASGGDEKTRFFISGAFDSAEGHYLRSDFDRFGLRTNFDHRATDKLSLTLNIGLSATRQFGTVDGGNFINGPIFQSQLEPTFVPIYLIDEDGNDTDEYYYWTRFSGAGGARNIVQYVEEENRITKTTQILGSTTATYRIAPWLSFRTLWGVNYRNSRDTNYRSSIIARPQGGTIFEANRNVMNWNTNQVFNYNFNIDGDHSISGLVGAEYRQEKRETFTVSAQGFPSPLFKTLQNAGENTGFSGFTSEFRIASLFSNFKYDFQEKYLFNASVRYDGSSRFGEDKRWGLFPAVSAAWRMTEEAFLRDVEILDEFKIRASYGITGNSSISNFASRSLFGTGGTYQLNAALAPSQLGNNILTWEEATSINLGLDWSIYEGRISGAVDVYRTTNDELLFSTPLPSDSGFSGITSNVGAVQNQGIEIELNTVNVNRNGFVWSSNFNISFQENEILRLTTDEDQPASGLFIGRPLGTYRLVQTAGVNPADGRQMWFDIDGNLTYNQSGADLIPTEYTTQPSVLGGFSNRLSYQGLSLDVFLQYSFDQYTFMQQENFFLDTAEFLGGMRKRFADNVWRQPGDISLYGRAYSGGVEPGSGHSTHRSSGTQALENASYIRLKNVTLSYNLPVDLVSQINLRGVRLFVQGRNLHTWTNFTGIDPEVIGSQNATFPQNREVAGGIEIQF